MKKDEKRVVAGFILVLLVLFAMVGVSQFFGGEDSRAEKEDWLCEDCKAQFPFSEFEAYRTHTGTEDCRAFRPIKLWGQGDPDPNYIKTFGNSNLSRLCFVQTNTINRQGQRIAELALRISKLEDPNNCPFGLNAKDCNEAPIHEH